jgi:hypothetical protein
MKGIIIPEDDKIIGEHSGKEIYQYLCKKIKEKRISKFDNRTFVSGLLNNKYLLQYIDRFKNTVYIYANDETSTYCFKLTNYTDKKYKIHAAVGFAVDLIYIKNQINVKLPIG